MSPLTTDPNDPRLGHDAVVEPEERDVHDLFGLSYSSHLVLPRVLLQSMPTEWQHRFVALMEDFDRAVATVDRPARYIVQAAYEREAWELTDTEMKLARIEQFHDDGDPMWVDDGGTEIAAHERVLVPTRDPLPPYQRGRTIIPLADGYEPPR